MDNFGTHSNSARSVRAVLDQQTPDPDQFASEETTARSAYPATYSAPRPLAEQIEVLAASFPSLDTAVEPIAESALPGGAEGLFAIPRWEAIASNYNDALEAAQAALKEHRQGKFFNYRRGRLGPEVLRQHPRTQLALQALAEQQPGRDILVVPAQFGLRHKGRSMRRVRALFTPNEFGLGAFHTTMMLLTHPMRLTHYHDLWPDCPGDEYDDLTQTDRYVRAPRFIFDGGQEEFGTHWLKHPEHTDGSVTGFIWESN